MTPYEVARHAFDDQASGWTTAIRIGELQQLLGRWQERHFGEANLQQLTLGLCEEAGEAAHCVLKASQRIRGMTAGVAEPLIADALADVTIFAMQIATHLRLDFGSLLLETARQVLLRNWNENPETGEAKPVDAG